MSVWGTFVELHDDKGRSYFVNAARVISFSPADDGGTWLFSGQGESDFHVQESSAEIIRLFQDATDGTTASK